MEYSVTIIVRVEASSSDAAVSAAYDVIHGKGGEGRVRVANVHAEPMTSATVADVKVGDTIALRARDNASRIGTYRRVLNVEDVTRNAVTFRTVTWRHALTDAVSTVDLDLDAPVSIRR